jgi:hypothetical protein
MRKSIFLLLFILSLLFVPARAQAQAAITLESLTIQLWPDHDQPKVLVIYDFLLDANTPLPAILHFQMPASAELVAVAKSSDSGLLTVDRTLSGDSRTVTFTITDQTGYHLEYYMPYTLEETTRDFVFTWQGDYAVKSFRLALQKPSAATNLITDLTLSEIPADKNGFSYLSTKEIKLAAQETFHIHVRYQNDTDTLSASTLTVQPSSSLTENVPGQVSVMTYLPWVLATLAVLLIVGGIGWYWFSSRGGADSVKPAQRRGERRKPAKAVDADKQVYCHQCGKRARPDDRFCRTCGAQLRQGE